MRREPGRYVPAPRALAGLVWPLAAFLVLTPHCIGHGSRLGVGESCGRLRRP